MRPQFRLALLRAFNLSHHVLGGFVPPESLDRPIIHSALRGAGALQGHGQPGPPAGALAGIPQDVLGLLVSSCTLASAQLTVPVFIGEDDEIAGSMAAMLADCRRQLWPDPPAARAQLAARDWVPAAPPAAGAGTAGSSSGGGDSGSTSAADILLAGLLHQHRPDVSAEALRLECLFACAAAHRCAAGGASAQAVTAPAWQEALQHGLLVCQLLMDALPEHPYPYLAAAHLLLHAAWLPTARRTVAVVRTAARGADLAERGQRELAVLALPC